MAITNDLESFISGSNPGGAVEDSRMKWWTKPVEWFGKQETRIGPTGDGRLNLYDNAW